MGFSIRRVCGPRRVVLCWEFDSGSVLVDPALDEAMDAKAYAESLFDPSHVKVKEGDVPAWFEIRAMPRALAIAADDLARAKVDWWIRCCLRKVENVEFDDGAGNAGPLELKFQKWNDKLDILDDATMEAIIGLGEGANVALERMIRKISEAGRGPLVRPSSKPSGETTS